MNDAIKIIDIPLNGQTPTRDTDASSPQRVTTGILPCQLIQEMLVNAEITLLSELDADQIQPASIDLRLGHFAYPVDTSFLPGEKLTVLEKMQQLDERYDEFKIKLKNGAVLEKERVYVIPLLEKLNLKNKEVAAFANPKSSTGRLDILTRLITDRGTAFDQVDRRYEGPLYVEVVPRTFSIVVKTGTRLNQLRFSRTSKSTPAPIAPTEWKRLLDDGEIVQLEDTERKAK